MSKPVNSFEQFLSDFGLKSIRSSESIPSPEPPKFPTFLELVALEEAKAPKEDRQDGLFQAVLHGNIAVLT